MEKKCREFIDEVKEKMNFTKDIELCNAIGVSKSAFDKWMQRDSIPPDKYKKIMDLVGDDEDSAPKISINYYKNVTASAGYGISVVENAPQKLELSEALLSGVKIQSYKHLDLISVAGDSMLPYFENGDKVLIERECVAKNGDTIIANIEGNLYIKRLEKDPFNKWVKLISNNSEYGSITLEGQEVEKINIIGIVRAKLSMKVY